MTVRAAFSIAAKDLKERLRDRSAYIVGIVAPLGLALIFGFVFSPIEEFDFSARFAVVDLDGGPAAALFVEGLEQAGDIELVRVATEEEAVELVDTEGNPFAEENSADAAFVIPAGFTEEVQSERRVELGVIGSAGSETNTGIAVAIAEQFASQLTSVRVAVATVEQLRQQQVDRFETGLRVLATPDPATLTDVSANTKQLDGATFYSAGLAIFFLFFTVQFGVNSLLEERHSGTMSRLLAAPISKSSIILGKAITAFLLGFVSLVVLVAATTALPAIGADWGDPRGVLALTLAAIVAALGIMAVTGAFAKTAEQAASISSIIAVILGFLGGTFFPVAQAGGVLAKLRLITPHAWFMQGLGDLGAGDLSVVVTPVLAMLAFGVVTGGVALIGVRRGLRV